MPRKVVPPTVAAPVPPPPPSPIVQRLRRDWRWAGISQFIYTFSDAFGLLDWDIEALERDFDGTEQALIPDLIAKLLYALTFNRQINRGNAFDHLRRQSLKRHPEGLGTGHVLGSEDDPLGWEALGLDQKIQILWQLCEWQLDDPSRFRSLLPSESDAPSWRVDPIGWDKAGNTYFLFDDNRLWIQRALPLPPRAPKRSSEKAKKARRAVRSAQAPKRSHKKRSPNPQTEIPATTLRTKAEEPASSRRQRKQVVFFGNLTPTVEALKGGSKVQEGKSPSRATRSSARSATSTPSKAAPSAPLPRGTRVSRRLHAVADEWQQVPEEWLATGQTSDATADDDESELSDLPDEDPSGADGDTADIASRAAKGASDTSSDSALSDAPSGVAAEEADEVGSVEPELQEDEEEDVEEEEEPEDEFESTLRNAVSLPEGFIEWEAVCVSLYDWKTFPEQFAKSKHADEKAFYKLLSGEVAPQILEVLEIKEQERLKQEAINNRKRSSRIAMRELEREEQQKREQAEREMEERMERSRQEEARKEREEEQLLSRERAREERLREREERLAARERAVHERAESEARQREQAERAREKRKRRREGEDVSEEEDTPSVGPSRADTATPSESQGSWELRCEVCKLHGWNLTDETDVVCCDDCGRWQHMPCHDRQDRDNGRKPRDWDHVDFRCQECEARANSAKRQRTDAEQPPLQPAHLAANGHPVNVRPLADVRQASNGSHRSGVPEVNIRHYSSGTQSLQGVNGSVYQQQPLRGPGVPPPLPMHSHASPQQHGHRSQPAQLATHPPDHSAPQHGYGSALYLTSPRAAYGPELAYPPQHPSSQRSGLHPLPYDRQPHSLHRAQAAPVPMMPQYGASPYLPSGQYSNHQQLPRRASYDSSRPPNAPLPFQPSVATKPEDERKPL